MEGQTRLDPKTAEQNETSWADPWEATKETRSAVYRREDFQRDLNKVGRRITDEINSDPEEVRRLRAARQEVVDGKTRPYRKRGAKSD